MILVDSSVWIDYFSGNDSAEADFLDHTLGNRAVAIGDLILTEVLQGFRHDKDYKVAKNSKVFGYYAAVEADKGARDDSTFGIGFEHKFSM